LLGEPFLRRASSAIRINSQGRQAKVIIRAVFGETSCAVPLANGNFLIKLNLADVRRRVPFLVAQFGLLAIEHKNVPEDGVESITFAHVLRHEIRHVMAMTNIRKILQMHEITCGGDATFEEDLNKANALRGNYLIRPVVIELCAIILEKQPEIELPEFRCRDCSTDLLSWGEAVLQNAALQPTVDWSTVQNFSHIPAAIKAFNAMWLNLCELVNMLPEYKSKFRLPISEEMLDFVSDGEMVALLAGEDVGSVGNRAIAGHEIEYLNGKEYNALSSEAKTTLARMTRALFESMEIHSLGATPLLSSFRHARQRAADLMQTWSNPNPASSVLVPDAESESTGSAFDFIDLPPPPITESESREDDDEFNFFQ
jgi:hypothetical protein